MAGFNPAIHRKMIAFADKKARCESGLFCFGPDRNYRE
jgi:hypothetical protein